MLPDPVPLLPRHHCPPVLSQPYRTTDSPTVFSPLSHTTPARPSPLLTQPPPAPPPPLSLDLDTEQPTEHNEELNPTEEYCEYPDDPPDCKVEPKCELDEVSRVDDPFAVTA